MSWFSDLLGFGDKGSQPDKMTNIDTMPIPVQLPDYAESTGARQDWWNTLQNWQSQPGYGAIQPDWNNIWDNARQKVQRYFQGGPEGPGAIAGVRANNARRGMSDNPASDATIGRLNMQQGNNLSDIATQMAIEQARLGESGRQTWLNSLQGLAGLKPAYALGSRSSISQGEPGVGTAQGVGDIFTKLLTNGISGGFSSGSDSSGGSGDSLGIGNILDMFGGGSDSGGGNSDWIKTLIKLGIQYGPEIAAAA